MISQPLYNSSYNRKILSTHKLLPILFIYRIRTEINANSFQYKLSIYLHQYTTLVDLTVVLNGLINDLYGGGGHQVPSHTKKK